MSEDFAIVFPAVTAHSNPEGDASTYNPERCRSVLRCLKWPGVCIAYEEAGKRIRMIFTLRTTSSGSFADLFADVWLEGTEVRQHLVCVYDGHAIKLTDSALNARERIHGIDSLGRRQIDSVQAFIDGIKLAVLEVVVKHHLKR